MAERNNDIENLKQWVFSIRPRHILFLILIAAGLLGLYFLKDISFSRVDTTDYKAVAVEFLRDNPTIAQKLGKVQSVRLLGAGGSAGKISYNSFNLKGEDKSAYCHVTLIKDENDKWQVKTATLIVDGAEYTIPVSRKDEKRILRIFQ